MFVMLTAAESGDAVFVHVGHVARVRPRPESGARVLLACGVEFPVREEPAEIVEAVSRALFTTATAAGRLAAEGVGAG